MDGQHRPVWTDGELKPPREREESTVSVADDARIVQLLADRDDSPTRVHLVDGQVLEVLNVAWGYDEGDLFAHVSTNVSFSVEDARSFPFENFFTSSVSQIADPKDGTVLFIPEAAQQAYETNSASPRR